MLTDQIANLATSDVATSGRAICGLAEGCRDRLRFQDENTTPSTHVQRMSRLLCHQSWPQHRFKSVSYLLAINTASPASCPKIREQVLHQISFGSKILLLNLFEHRYNDALRLRSVGPLLSGMFGVLL